MIKEVFWSAGGESYFVATKNKSFKSFGVNDSGFFVPFVCKQLNSLKGVFHVFVVVRNLWQSAQFLMEERQYL